MHSDAGRGKYTLIQGCIVMQDVVNLLSNGGATFSGFTLIVGFMVMRDVVKSPSITSCLNYESLKNSTPHVRNLQTNLNTHIAIIYTLIHSPPHAIPSPL